MTKINDVGTLRLDGGKSKIDDANRVGMGWMTFQDGVAYSRNVVAAKVALGLGHIDARVLGDPLRHVDPARLRQADRHRRRRRGERHHPRPGDHALARARPRQRLIRSGRRGHADPARDGIRRRGQRRVADPAACRQGSRRSRHRSGGTRPGARPEALGDAARDDAPRHHRGAVLSRQDARSRLRRRRQDGHRPDLGCQAPTTATGPGRSTSSTTRSSATSAGRQAFRT